MNPDVTGAIQPSFVYAFRYRSSFTGAKSNPSPIMRASAIQPKRQSVTLTAPAASSDAQADLIDWFRFGTSLPANGAYLGSSTTTTFVDDYTDSEVLNAGGVDLDQFQPYPTADLPRSGLVTTAGSAVSWVSGDTFNPLWAPGSQILINGIACTLYQQPVSTTLLHIVESVGALIGVPFEMPSPVLLGTALPVQFGPYQGYLFGLGSPTDPGTLFWTKKDDPDAASDQNRLTVTSNSTPLQNGFIWDGQPFVFDTENLYRIVPTNDENVPFFVQQTPCGRGLWNRWGFCLTPYGILFLAKDGIYLTAGGDVAKSVTNADLAPLFPHDGGPGTAVNGVLTPDMSALTNLRLNYIDGFGYFDYAAVVD